MIIVTGGAGFIGSNLVKKLSAESVDEIIVVDDLTQGQKFHNLVDCKVQDYWDKEDCQAKLAQLKTPPKAIIHLGACSDTTEWDGRYLMQNNYQYSKDLLHYSLDHQCQYLYASSAAVYGENTTFVESPEHEKPLNMYGYSKFLFDQYARQYIGKSKIQIAGLRYFNVYGPREQHKARMASVAYHHHQQLEKGDSIRLFEGSHGYADGEQQRDFVYVKDTVSVKMWLLENPQVSGIFNTGTGRAQSFNDVANTVLKAYGRGKIDYIPFPEDLKKAYQSYTQADISALRGAGYTKPFHSVETGVADYMRDLEVSVQHEYA